MPEHEAEKESLQVIFSNRPCGQTHSDIAQVWDLEEPLLLDLPDQTFADPKPDSFVTRTPCTCTYSSAGRDQEHGLLVHSTSSSFRHAGEAAKPLGVDRTHSKKRRRLGLLPYTPEGRFDLKTTLIAWR